MIAKRKLPAGTDALAAWRALARDPGRVALDSAAEGPGTGRWSIVASRPLARVVWRETSLEVIAANGTVLHAVPTTKTESREGAADPFAAVREILAWFRADATPELGELPFAGGAIGWFSYELGRRLLPQKFAAPREDADPPLELALFGGAIVVDRASGEAWAAGADTALGRGEDEAQRLERAILDVAVRTNPQARVSEPPPSRRPTPPWHEQTAHRDAVTTVRRYIEAGDIYQANVSARFEAVCAKTANELWPKLRETSPEPFAACIEGIDRVVLSASMERLISVKGRHVETRPIKGTRPRGGTPADDERLRRELATSEKDSAELLMIVDLHRNDLGKVCRPGSVVVPTLYGVRTFARVHHLEATITGRLREEMDALDALRAVFPAGSITGAPKVRAMQILEEVEPSPRGIYCGAIGYLGLDGSADFAVAIRTAVLREGLLRWSAGGGIVWDSDPADEWREVIAKSTGFRALLE